MDLNVFFYMRVMRNIAKYYLCTKIYSFYLRMGTYDMMLKPWLLGTRLIYMYIYVCALGYGIDIQRVCEYIDYIREMYKSLGNVMYTLRARGFIWYILYINNFTSML